MNTVAIEKGRLGVISPEHPGSLGSLGSEHQAKSWPGPFAFENNFQSSDDGPPGRPNSNRYGSHRAASGGFGGFRPHANQPTPTAVWGWLNPH